jgi:Cu+-exporting ATPase
VPGVLRARVNLATEQAGDLLRGAEALEFAAKLSTVVLDKTGTLTRGEPEVTNIVPVNGFPARDLLHFAASAEQGSEHPLGEAIVQRARAVGVTLAHPATFLAVPGQGIRARADGWDDGRCPHASLRHHDWLFHFHMPMHMEGGMVTLAQVG